MKKCRFTDLFCVCIGFVMAPKPLYPKSVNHKIVTWNTNRPRRLYFTIFFNFFFHLSPFFPLNCVCCHLFSADNFSVFMYKKNLKIPKGQSETVYRRITDNTMAKRKSTKDKQRSTKHTYKTKDRVTRTPLKTGGELMCSGRVNSSCSILSISIRLFPIMSIPTTFRLFLVLTSEQTACVFRCLRYYCDNVSIS